MFFPLWKALLSLATLKLRVRVAWCYAESHLFQRNSRSCAGKITSPPKIELNKLKTQSLGLFDATPTSLVNGFVMVKTKSNWIGLSWPLARELIRAQVSLHLARFRKQPIICICFIHGSVVSIRSLFFLLLFYQEAIAAESFIESTPMCVEKGDLERGFADSDHVLQGEMRMGGQVCLLRWKWQSRCILLTELNALKRNLMRYILVATWHPLERPNPL